MSGKKKNDDDLTSIENLGEFIHEDDTQINNLFKKFNQEPDDNLDSDDLPPPIEELFDNQSETLEENPSVSFEENDSVMYDANVNDDHSLNDEAYSELDDGVVIEDSESNNDFDFSSDTSISNETIHEDITSLDSNHNEFENENDSQYSHPETEIFNPDPQFDIQNDISDDEYLNEVQEELTDESYLDSPPALPEDSSELNRSIDNLENILNDTQDSSFKHNDNYGKSDDLGDVKKFANEYSYAKDNTRIANPPFSMIIKNIKYTDDINEIIDIIKDLKIYETQDLLEDLKSSLTRGQALISQIGEYKAIYLAHKLRKFNLDIEVGLSDEIHKSSLDDTPKGLIKKESIRQNIKEQFVLNNYSFTQNNIVVTNTSELSGFKVIDFLDVHSVMSVICNEDLDKLSFVDKAIREDLDIFTLTDSENEDEVLSIYKNYQKSFETVFDELVQKLKTKAVNIKANVIYNLNFRITPLDLNIQSNQKQYFSITATGTFVKAIKE